MSDMLFDCHKVKFLRLSHSKLWKIILKSKMVEYKKGLRATHVTLKRYMEKSYSPNVLSMSTFIQ